MHIKNLERQITQANEELDKAVTAKSLSLEAIVRQLAAVNAALARMGNYNYSEAIANDTKNLDKLTVTYVGTYNNWKVLLFTGASTAFKLGLAFAGLGLAGATLQTSSTALQPAAGLPDAFSGLSEQGNQASRTTLDLKRDEARMLRQEMMENRGRNRTAVDSDIGVIRQADRARQETISNLMR